MGFCLLEGARTVVHPKARIIAEAGPIVIGEGNLIEEQVLIINRYARPPLRAAPAFSSFAFSFWDAVFSSISYPEDIQPDTEGAEPKTMVVGTNNVFEVGCGILGTG